MFFFHKKNASTPKSISNDMAVAGTVLSKLALFVFEEVFEGVAWGVVTDKMREIFAVVDEIELVV